MEVAAPRVAPPSCRAYTLALIALSIVSLNNVVGALPPATLGSGTSSYDLRVHRHVVPAGHRVALVPARGPFVRATTPVWRPSFAR